MRVIAQMLGFPQEDADRFRGFVKHVLEGVALPMEERAEGMMVLFEYLREQVQDHIDNPRDDLTSFLLDAEMDGEQLDIGHVGGTIALLLIAGIDTTWSAIGASLWHLAEDAGRPRAARARARAAADGDRGAAAGVRPRDHGPPREGGHGVEGLPDEGGGMGAAAVPRRRTATRRCSSDPDEVVIDREVNRHAAFGLGIHRCAGSHLARMELRVALEEWLRRLPVVLAGRSRRRDVVGRAGARPPQAADPHRLTADGPRPR